jgi:RNA polymerase sigma-70 factor, ECF subfamily
MSSNTDDLPLDERAFGACVEPHRRELHVHCYRLLGSFEEAEDLVQEAFLRAWRRRETYEARASVRAWLYKIATNACLDALDKAPAAAERER